MKTKEELNAIKGEVETVRRKLTELTGEELEQVCGGYDPGNFAPDDNDMISRGKAYALLMSILAGTTS